MKPIDKFFFWTEGVILPAISTVSLDYLNERSSHPLLDSQRFLIHQSEKKLAIGKINLDDFQALLGSLMNDAGKPDDWIAGLMPFVQVNEAVLSTAVDLKNTGRVYLISDYPRKWLQAIQTQFGIMDCFSAQDVIYTQDLHLNDPLNSVFERLIAEGMIEPGTSIWVDAYPPRTSAAIRRGIDAIIYVDERRLRRELNLRKLLA